MESRAGKLFVRHSCQRVLYCRKSCCGRGESSCCACNCCWAGRHNEALQVGKFLLERAQSGQRFGLIRSQRGARAKVELPQLWKSSSQCSPAWDIEVDIVGAMQIQGELRSQRRQAERGQCVQQRTASTQRLPVCKSAVGLASSAKPSGSSSSSRTRSWCACCPLWERHFTDKPSPALYRPKESCSNGQDVTSTSSFSPARSSTSRECMEKQGRWRNRGKKDCARKARILIHGTQAELLQGGACSCSSSSL